VEEIIVIIDYWNNLGYLRYPKDKVRERKKTFTEQKKERKKRGTTSGRSFFYPTLLFSPWGM